MAGLDFSALDRLADEGEEGLGGRRASVVRGPGGIDEVAGAA